MKEIFKPNKFYLAIFFALLISFLTSSAVQGQILNGDFETGIFSSWVQTNFLNPGLTGTAPFNRGNIVRTPGGNNQSEVVGGPAIEPFSLSDNNSGGIVKYPAFGHYSARINGSTTGKISNTISQTFTISSTDIGSDGIAHIDFAYAAVMQDPQHNPSEQPWFFVSIKNNTRGITLYDKFRYSGDVDPDGVDAWKAGNGDWKYIDWVTVDLNPGPGKLEVGDSITLEAIAADCSLGAHAGYVYIDRGDPTLTISHIEISQAIQDTMNSIPLILGKRTFVRVYMDCGLVCGNGVDATGILRAYRNETPISYKDGTTERFDLPPLENLSIKVHHQSLDVQRANLGNSLNFQLPSEWVANETITIKAIVNGTEKYIEQDGNKNLNFVRAKPLTISYVPIEVNGSHPEIVSMESADILLRQLYPANEINYLNSHMQLTWTPPLLCEALQFYGANNNSRTCFDKNLQNFLNQEYKEAYGDVLLGWLPSNTNIGLNGASDEKKVVFALVNSDFTKRNFLLAHEVAHNLGRPDINNPYTGKCSDIGDDEWPNSTAEIQQFGLQWLYSTLSIKAPTSSDYMSYCQGEVWTSPHTYRNLYSQWFTPTPMSSTSSVMNAQGENVYYSVSGLVTSDGSVDFDPIRSIVTSNPIIPTPGATYCIEARDNTNIVLTQYCFDLSFTNEGTGEPSMVDGFNLMIPKEDAISQIVLKKDGLAIGSKTASINKPQVSIISPNGSEIWNESEDIVITWHADDLDGDELRFDVDYSIDGNHWIRIGTNITNTYLNINSNELPSSTTGLIRVGVTDGFNTASDQSDSTFIVRRKKPHVSILSPDNNGVIVFGSPAYFNGVASDSEDGKFGNSNLVWSSNLDGFLGSGENILATLSLGNHVITLTATDSDGNQAIATTNYKVQNCYRLNLIHSGQGTDPVATPTNSAGCPENMFIGGEAIQLSNATPDTGWAISSWEWTNNDTSMAPNNTVTMPAGNLLVRVNYTSNSVIISGSTQIGGVTLNYEDNGPQSTLSDASGNYMIGVHKGWSGTVTPSLVDYTFTPPQKTYSSVTSDLANQDYVATYSLPADFNKITPISGASGQSTSAVLTWEISNRATSYEYCYDTTNDNLCSAWVNNGTATSKTLTGLNAGTTYYWQVRAVNVSGTTPADGDITDFWSFKTKYDIEQISVSSTGAKANYDSRFPSVSTDGRYVAFYSAANNLVNGDTNARGDVFVRDRITGQTTRVSLSSIGAQGNGDSRGPSISGDGRYVAFYSYASNLITGDTNGFADVFVYDRTTGQITRVSVSYSGAQANDGSEYAPSISANGNYVGFTSWASNLFPTNRAGPDVFVRDIQASMTMRASVNSLSNEQGSGYSWYSSVTNGGNVAFLSDVNSLVNGDTNGTTDVFYYNYMAGQTSRASISSDGSQSNGGTIWGIPAYSADARYIAFSTNATNLVPGDTNGYEDVFVHDTYLGTTTRVSIAPNGQQGNNHSSIDSISRDGRYIVFSSLASNLVNGDTNGYMDVFVHDRLTGETTLISSNASGVKGNNDSSTGSISADGQFIAFSSLASNLVSNDTNNDFDVFIKKLDVPTALPGTFVLDGPAYGATNQTTSPTLTWIASSNVDHYEYCYDTTNDGLCSNWVNNGLSTSVTLQGLTQGVTYYWHVRAINSVGMAYAGNVDANFFSFTVRNTPDDFSKSGPVDNAINLSTAPTMVWNSSIGAASYEYCYDQTNDNDCSPWLSSGLSTAITLSGLSNNTTYYWQVRAKNVFGTTYANNDSWWSFTTCSPTIVIAGNAGVTSATITYTNGSITADASGNYSFTVPSDWSGTVTLTKAGYTFTPASKTYTHALTNQVGQDYVATLNTYTISGNTGVAGAALNYIDGVTKIVTADGSGYYSIIVPYDWSGTVTPTKAGYTFTPTNKTYTHILTNQTGQNYATTLNTYTISGSTGVTGATLNYIDGVAKIVTADGNGYYSIIVPYNWSGTVTPTKAGYTFTPTNKTYTNILTNQTGQNYAPTLNTYTISGSAGVTGATLTYVDGVTKTVTVDGSGYYSIIVPYDWSGTVTPAKVGYTFTPISKAYFNITGNQVGQNYSPTIITESLTVKKTGTGEGMISSAPSGIVCGTDCTEFYNYSTNVTLTAAPSAGSVFMGWGGACTGTGPCIVTITTAQIVTANFIRMPDPFAKLSPTDNTFGLTISPILAWTPSTGAIGYEYCIDITDNDVCDSNLWVGTGAKMKVSMRGLDVARTYYWQVRAINSAGTIGATQADSGTWYSFSTQPGAFNKISPLNRSSASLAPTLNWAASTGATGYEYCIDTTSGSSCDGTWKSVGNGTSIAIGPLSPSTTYYWQVRSIFAGGYSYGNNAWWSFTTSNGFPAAFTKSSPTNGSSGQSTSITLTWAASTNATSYQYCIDTTNNSKCDSSWISVGTDTSVTPGGLLNGKTYYWQVQAVNSYGATDANNRVWWSFSIQPGNFNKLAPANTSKAVGRTRTFAWSASDGATSYEYCYDTTANNICDGGKWMSAGTARSVTLILRSGLTYYWQVRAVYSSGLNPTKGYIYADGTTTWWKFTILP